MGLDVSKVFPAAAQLLISKSEPSGRGVDLFPAEELAKHLQNEAAPRERRQTRHPGEDRIRDPNTGTCLKLFSTPLTRNP